MKCLLLGEGPSDLGVNDDYSEPRFQKGPMTLVIDFLALKKDVREIEYELLSRGDVSRGIKKCKRQIASRPKNVDQRLRAIYHSAWYVGALANKSGKDAVVYFHDPDHTNSEPANTAARMEVAMEVGFNLAEYKYGVPMIPVPRSEAWLLAYFQKGLDKQTAYNKAARFENLPANDDSANSAKKLLQIAVGAKAEGDVYPKIMEEFSDIDWTLVDMPSYNRFRTHLESVIEAYKATIVESKLLESYA